MATHKLDCLFGPGFYRVVYYADGIKRLAFYENQAQAEAFARLIATGPNVTIQRDACLDAQEAPDDALTPDVVDGEKWLGLPRAEAMKELGVTTDADYGRAHRSVSEMVGARNNRQSQGGERASIILHRRKTRETAAYFDGGSLYRIKSIRTGA